MKTPTYEDYLANPAAVRADVHRAASRARAEAMYVHGLASLARFCAVLVSIRGLKLQLDPRAAAKPAA